MAVDPDHIEVSQLVNVETGWRLPPGILVSVVLALVLAVAAGWAASLDRLTMVALIMVPVMTVIILFLGPTNAILLTFVLVSLPFGIKSLGLPVALPLVAACAFVVATGQRSRRRAPTLPSLAWWEIALPLAFAGSVVLSLLVAGHEEASVTLFGQLQACLASVAFYFLVIVAIDSEQAILGAARAVALAGFVCAVIATVQYLAPGAVVLTKLFGEATALGGGLPRVSAPFGDYELLAEMLAMATVACIWVALQSRGGVAIWWVAAGVWCAAVVMTTGTRGGVLLVLAGVALLFAVRGNTNSRLRLVLVFVVAVVALAFLLSVFAEMRAVLDRFALTPTSGSLGTILNRQYVWNEFLAQIRTPLEWTLGRGPINFRLSGFPHSMYIFTLYTQGIIGLSIYAGLWLAVVVRAVTALRRRSGDVPLQLFLILVVMLAIDGVKSEYTRLFGYQIFVWGVLGLAVAGRRIHAAEQRRRLPLLSQTEVGSGHVGRQEVRARGSEGWGK